MVDRESPSEPDAIFLLSLETGEKRRLTSSRVNSFGDQYPRFSPDGRTVAFERWGAVLKSDIYLVPAEGGDPRRLTAKNNPVWGFDWSADGESLIVASGYPTVSRRGDRLCIRTLEGTVDVWREGGPASAAEDSQPSRLISSPIYSNFAEYSPDGRQILFTSFRSGSDELWICDADGSAPRQLTHLQRSNGAFTGTWSPDGRRIAFCGIENDDYDIYVVDAAGGVPRRITSEPSDDGYPSWSRDGHFIYFGSTRSGRFEVFKTAAAGGEAQQITTGGGVYAVESHDGSQLFFTKRGIEGGPAGIWRMPVDGAEAVQVHDIGQFDSWQLFEDGICLLNRRVKPPSIDFLDFATGEIRRVGTIKGPGIPSALGFSVSPDRRWVLYQGWDTEYGIILVENFR
jgi:Tol biopolymer transport system component